MHRSSLRKVRAATSWNLVVDTLVNTASRNRDFNSSIRGDIRAGATSAGQPGSEIFPGNARVFVVLELC